MRMNNSEEEDIKLLVFLSLLVVIAVTITEFVLQ